MATMSRPLIAVIVMTVLVVIFAAALATFIYLYGQPPDVS